MAIEVACQHTIIVKSIPIIIGYKLYKIVINSAFIILENPSKVKVTIILKSFTDSIYNLLDI